MEEFSSSNVIDLSQSLRDKECEIELLQRTFTEVGSELDLDRVFQIVSERALGLIDAETILIPLLDDNHETYTYRGGAGVNAREIIGEALPLEFGVCGWVWKHRKPWWQGMLDELSEEEKNRWEKEAGNMILVPLQGKRHFLGGIAGLNKVGGSSFNKRDLNMLQLFASIVSVAIENAIAVKNIEASNELNEDYRLRLEVLNKQLVESSKELEYLSLYDSITALPNRSLFHDRLMRDITEARQNNSSIAVLLIDIDRFKSVNDTHGHAAGDMVLNGLGQMLKSSARETDIVGRYGGEEFGILLTETSASGAKEVGERIRTILSSTPITFGQQTISFSASLGISSLNTMQTRYEDLISEADNALYSAKTSGRNQVCLAPSLRMCS